MQLGGVGCAAGQRRRQAAASEASGLSGPAAEGLAQRRPQQQATSTKSNT